MLTRIKLLSNSTTRRSLRKNTLLPPYVGIVGGCVGCMLRYKDHEFPTERKHILSFFFMNLNLSLKNRRGNCNRSIYFSGNACCSVAPTLPAYPLAYQHLFYLYLKIGPFKK